MSYKQAAEIRAREKAKARDKKREKKVVELRGYARSWVDHVKENRDKQHPQDKEKKND